jgi:hypothetical protein
MRWKITIVSKTPSGLEVTDTIRFEGTFAQAIKRAGQHRNLLVRCTTIGLTIKPMADRRKYQRDLMRKRRANKVGSIEANLALDPDNGDPNNYENRREFGRKIVKSLAGRQGGMPDPRTPAAQADDAAKTWEVERA